MPTIIANKVSSCAKSQPAFMLLLIGPTVSIGAEHFYSNNVEVTNGAGGDRSQ